MVYCEVAQKECTEMSRQEDYTLGFGIFADRAVAHSGAVELCQVGADLNEGIVSEDECGMILMDEREKIHE